MPVSLERASVQGVVRIPPHVLWNTIMYYVSLNIVMCEKFSKCKTLRRPDGPFEHVHRNCVMCIQVRPKTRDQAVFYDMWVARDAYGLPFMNTRPFVSHQYSVIRMEQGLPFPVTCCWNGLVAINPAPFRQGYQFRCAPLPHNIYMPRTGSWDGEI
jgi:hypothetical protein